MRRKSPRSLKRPRSRSDNRASGASRREPNAPSEEQETPRSLSRDEGYSVISSSMSVKKITIEHVTIRSSNTFAAVRASLEALVPRLDDGFLTLLRFGLIDRARQELEFAATLSIFGSRDHGALLAIAGLGRQAIQYDIGNPLTASLMTRHKVSAGLYAPVRSYSGKVPRAKLHLSTTGRLRRSDSSVTKELTWLLGSSTKIWKAFCTSSQLEHDPEPMPSGLTRWVDTGFAKRSCSTKI